VSSDEARAEYLAENDFWGAGLINELESLMPGIAAAWAADAVAALVGEAQPSRKSMFIRWARDVSSATDASAVDNLSEEVETVWFEDEADTNKAMSKVIAAKVFFLRGWISSYKTELVMALRILGNNEHCRRTSAAIPLSLFDTYRAKLTKSP